MEGMIKKIEALFNDLQAKSVELNARESELNTRAEVLSTEEKALAEAKKSLTRAQKTVERITDVVAEEKKVAQMHAETKAAAKELAKKKEDFEAYAEARKKGLDNLQKETEDINTDIIATRARLQVEVKKVAQMKETFKADVLAELANKAG